MEKLEAENKRLKEEGNKVLQLLEPGNILTNIDLENFKQALKGE